MGEISLTLRAGSPEELELMVTGLASAFGGVDALAARVTTAAVEVNPLSGSSTLAANLTKAAETAPAAAAAAAAAEEAKPEAPAPAPTPAPAPEPQPEGPAVNVVGNQSPAAIRDEAIKMLMETYGKSPSMTTELADLQRRFGVKMFKEVPDEKAAEFAAAVRLLVNGTGQVSK